MSSRLSAVASTHTTPMMALVQRCEQDGRGVISTAFMLVKRGLAATLEDGMEMVGKYRSRPDITILLAMGKNYSTKP